MRFTFKNYQLLANVQTERQFIIKKLKTFDHFGLKALATLGNESQSREYSSHAICVSG